MDFLIVLLLALLVGVSGAIYFRIFRFVYSQNGGKVIATQFTRADGYMVIGCLTIFALQCFQNLQVKGNTLPATIDTGMLVIVQLGFWLLVIGTILVSFLFRRMRPAESFARGGPEPAERPPPRPCPLASGPPARWSGAG